MGAPLTVQRLTDCWLTLYDIDEPTTFEARKIVSREIRRLEDLAKAKAEHDAENAGVKP